MKLFLVHSESNKLRLVLHFFNHEDAEVLSCSIVDFDVLVCDVGLAVLEKCVAHVVFRLAVRINKVETFSVCGGTLQV